MFTGIALGMGAISSIQPAGGDGLNLKIKTGFKLSSPQVGESISVNGVCLTATEITTYGFCADVSPETMSRTALNTLKIGDKVNLERAISMSDRLGGHIVTGHIDTVGTVRGKRALRGFYEYEIGVEREFMRYIVEKGSIAIDGISLTVNAVGDGWFNVAIIPHTAQITTMGLRNIGDRVNIELDIIGKYIEKMLSPWIDKLSGGRNPDKAGRGIAPDVSNSGIDEEFLTKYGFLR